MSPTLQIFLLGTFHLVYNQKPITTTIGARAKELLAYLVLHAGKPQSRQHLAGLFWPDTTEYQSRTNLRKVLFDLRRALPDADRFLQMDRNTVQWLDTANYRLDVAALDELLEQIEQGSSDSDTLATAVERYHGELLLGCYDDWIIALRDQIHRRVQAALAALVTQLEKQRQYEASLIYAQRLLAMDPVEEDTYRRLMRLHSLMGNRSNALRVYRDCVHVLQRELGVEPDPETQEFYGRILSQNSQTKSSTAHENGPLVDAIGMVGRETEWRALQSAWQQAMQGRARFVAIHGEAGIGKTRLAEELLTWIDRQGFLTARARSLEAQGLLAYAPAADCLRALNRQRSLERLDDLWLVELARLLPELLVQRRDLPHPGPMSEGWQRLHLFEALTRALRIDGEPLLLLFDDLQWCDRETLEWLHFLLDHGRDQPLMVLATVRDLELDADHPYLRLQTALNRAGQLMKLSLTPLDATQTLVLANQLRETDLSDAQAADLYTQTGGNPLFVVETVRAGAEGKGEPSAEYAAAGLPPKVYALIESRLARLSPQALEIASLVAAAGTTCTYETLMAAARQDEDTLVDSLDELWRRRIVVERSEGYDFSHDRLRDVAYAELSNARRRLLHRHIANALLTVHGGELEAVYGQLAEQSARAGAVEDAVRYYRLAGDHARRLYALAEALGLYQRALTLSGKREGCDDLLEQVAQLHLALYHGEEAVEAHQHLLQNAKEQDDAERATKFLLGLGRAYYIVAMDRSTSDAVRNSWNAYEEAYQTAREHDDWHSMIDARVGTRYHVMFSMDYFADARHRIDEALALSREAKNDRFWLDSWMAAFHFRTPIEWVREGERLASTPPPDLDRASLIELTFLLQVAHSVTGDFERSVAYGNACIELATASGVLPVQYPSYNALSLLQQGKYAKAWHSLQQDVTDESHPFASAFQSLVMGIYLVDLLAYADGARLLAQVIEQAHRLHRPWLAELATVHQARALALGGLADDAELTRISDALSKLNTTLLGRIIGLPAVAMGEIAIALNRPTVALDCLLEAISVAKQEGRSPDVLMACEVLSRNYLRLNRFEEALHVTDRALAQAEQMNHRSILWRLLDVRAQALQGAGHQSAAHESARTCADLLQALALELPKPTQQTLFLSDERVLAVGEMARVCIGAQNEVSQDRSDSDGHVISMG